MFLVPATAQCGMLVLPCSLIIIKPPPSHPFRRRALVAVYQVAAGGINALCIAGGLAAVASDDGAARLWPACFGQHLLEASTPAAATGIALLPAGRPRVALGCEDGTLGVLQMESGGSYTRLISSHAAPLTAIAAHPTECGPAVHSTHKQEVAKFQATLLAPIIDNSFCMLPAFCLMRCARHVQAGLSMPVQGAMVRCGCGTQPTTQNSVSWAAAHLPCAWRTDPLTAQSLRQGMTTAAFVCGILCAAALLRYVEVYRMPACMWHHDGDI